MRILVMSDSHHKKYNMDLCVRKVGRVDMILHLGDIEGSEEYLREIAGCPVKIVKGNNDFFTREAREEEFSLGPYKCLMTHGHMYGVTMGIGRLIEEAKTRECQVLFFGHTHVPFYREIEGLHVFNPGSLGYPRQADYEPTYGLVEVDRFDRIHFTHCYLNR